jgi:hypothetical protein
VWLVHVAKLSPIAYRRSKVVCNIEAAFISPGAANQPDQLSIKTLGICKVGL